MKTFIFIFLLGSMLLLTTNYLPAQNDEGFIYGTVTTIDDDVYQGHIRWNDEEAFWFDMFNSEKQGNDFLKYLTRQDKRKLEEEQSEWYDRWRIFDEDDYDHTFVCQFGDIRKIKILDSDEVELTFKDGASMDLKGGSNDIGTTIYVLDEEVGEIALKWSRIEEVSFLPTPKKLKKKYGNPIFGTVFTEQGDQFKGYIQWDHDERLSVDELDGDHRDGEVSVEFGNIQSIEKHGNGSLVILGSGRELYLRGSNDVNDENRGIIVNVPRFGRVDIPWDEFEKVVFETGYQESGPAYDDYKIPERLTGTVYFEDDDKISGLIIYDLDESYGFEILQGELDDMEFLIPFRNIKVIDPKNYSYSKIELKDGKKILLGESHDVTSDNYGVLVQVGDDEYRYFLTRDIDRIEFE